MHTGVAHSLMLYARFISAMKDSTMIKIALLIALGGLNAACAHPDQNVAVSNSNAAQQANSNSSKDSTDGITPSSGTPLVVQQVPSASPKPPEGQVQPAAKPADAASTPKPTSAGARAPKLVAPQKRIDFGKQPQDKNLVRAIAIRNGGKSDLKIESIVPS